jgi:crotonobetainyl-CoA:carnitine CoA-transferase CaiB-like acyl-CoA transferase
VPYQTFATSDGDVVIAVGNDPQFRRFCQLLGVPDWADDPRFATNAARVRQRDQLIPQVAERVRRRSNAEWLRDLEQAGIPCGEVRQLAQVFADPQVGPRDLLCEVSHPTIGSLSLAGSPYHLGPHSESVRARSGWRPPPLLGEHTFEVLKEILDVNDSDLAELSGRGVIAGTMPQP